MRKLAMTAALGLVAVGVNGFTPAQADEAPDAPTCTEEHLSGDHCQGADAFPDAAQCKLKVWVGSASCVVSPADGAANFLNLGGSAHADVGTDPEFHYRVTDLSTGDVVREGVVTNAGSDGCGVDDLPLLVPQCLAGRALLSGTSGQPGGSPGPFLCEGWGTHSQYGAGTAAFGETPDIHPMGVNGNPPQYFNNTLRCSVG